MKLTQRAGGIGFRRALAGMLALVWAGVAGAEEAAIRIKEEAWVKGPKVYLSDLVEVKERELKERLADIEVSSAARPGDSKSLNATLVEARLEHAGVDLERVALDRPSQVRATTMHLDVTPEMMAASLREHIELAMPWDPALTEIDISLPRQGIQAPDGDLLIDWRAAPSYRYLGLTNFRGEVLVDGVHYRTIVVRAGVETYQEILVAATDISRGRPLAAAHVKKQIVALSQAPDGAITAVEDIVGLIARKTIFPNQPITSRNVDQPKLIKRNQTVLVEVNSGSIHIQHQARAMMDGKVGDVIVCANPVTKQEFQGVVRADGVVEVQ